jgi:phosphohistidine phosphatase
MKTLLILRHAKSSWKEEELDDHERPLNKRGLIDAPRMGELLKEHDLVPEYILSSSAVRAHLTAQLVAEHCGYEGEIGGGRELYSFASEDYLDALQKLDDGYVRVMVVGHNPGLEELAEWLTGVYTGLPTAALAVVRLDINHWSELEEGGVGELVQVFRPKEL